MIPTSSRCTPRVNLLRACELRIRCTYLLQARQRHAAGAAFLSNQSLLPRPVCRKTRNLQKRASCAAISWCTLTIFMIFGDILKAAQMAVYCSRDSTRSH
jgi:hypothetical protein